MSEIKKKSEDKSIPTWVHGATGRMGVILQELIAEKPEKFHVVGGSGHDFLDSGLHKDVKLDVKHLSKELQRTHTELIIDFSSLEGNDVLAKAVEDSDIKDSAILIATTGLSDAQLAQWKKIAKDQSLKVLFARNTSIGVSLLIQCSLQLTSVLFENQFDIEIHESHHRNKKDAPSGTALMIADAIEKVQPALSTSLSHDGGRKENSIGMSVTRGGSVFGEHRVSFLGDDEELHISHKALNRRLFARGALTLSSWLLRQGPGAYWVEDIRPETMIAPTVK